MNNEHTWCIIKFNYCWFSTFQFTRFIFISFGTRLDSNFIDTAATFGNNKQSHVNLLLNKFRCIFQEWKILVYAFPIMFSFLKKWQLPALFSHGANCTTSAFDLQNRQTKHTRSKWNWLDAMALFYIFFFTQRSQSCCFDKK